MLDHCLLHHRSCRRSCIEHRIILTELCSGRAFLPLTQDSKSTSCRRGSYSRIPTEARLGAAICSSNVASTPTPSVKPSTWLSKLPACQFVKRSSRASTESLFHSPLSRSITRPKLKSWAHSRRAFLDRPQRRPLCNFQHEPGPTSLPSRHLYRQAGPSRFSCPPWISHIRRSRRLVSTGLVRPQPHLYHLLTPFLHHRVQRLKHINHLPLIARRRVAAPLRRSTTLEWPQTSSRPDPLQASPHADLQLRIFPNSSSHHHNR